MEENKNIKKTLFFYIVTCCINTFLSADREFGNPVFIKSSRLYLSIAHEFLYTGIVHESYCPPNSSFSKDISMRLSFIRADKRIGRIRGKYHRRIRPQLIADTYYFL